MNWERRLPKVVTPQPCPSCGKRGGHECGRVECANRKPVTASPPHHTTHGPVPTGINPLE
jgi:hypothetical protein